MKKLYTVLSVAAMSAMAFTAKADLGTATLTEPTGDYISNVTEIVIQWMNDGEPSTIELVNPQTNEDGTKYVEVTVNIGNEDHSVPATLYQGKNGSVEGSEDTGLGLIISWGYGDAPFYGTNNYGWPALQTGDWSVSVPAESVQADSEMNTQFDTSFKVYASTGADPDTNPVLYSSSQATDVESYSPSDLANLEFVWFDYTSVELLGDITITKQVLDNEGWGYGDVESDDATQVLPMTTGSESATLSCDLSKFEEGVYKISFPEKCVILDGNTIYNGGMDYFVKIFNGMSAGSLVYPESTVASTFSTLIFSWDGNEITFVSEDKQTVSVELPNGETQEVTATLNYQIIGSDEEGTPDFGPTRADEDVYNALMIDLFDLINEKGDGRYYITIPEGLVQNSEGLINPAQTIDISVYPISEVKAEFTIDEEENTLTVSYSGFAAIDTNYSKPVEIRNTTTGETATPFLWFMDGEATISLEGYEDGTYELVIPEAAFYFYTENYEQTYINQDETYEFTIEDGKTSAVKALESVKAEVKGVYNLQGVKVADDAANLPAGLYIINGKKVLVRK